MAQGFRPKPLKRFILFEITPDPDHPDWEPVWLIRRFLAKRVYAFLRAAFGVAATCAKCKLGHLFVWGESVRESVDRHGKKIFYKNQHRYLEL